MTAKPPRSALAVGVLTFVVMAVLLVGGGVAIIVATDDGSSVEVRSEKLTQGALTFSTICAVLAYLRRQRKLEGR